VPDYLRFSPDEYRALTAACRGLRLTDDFFPCFKYFLLETLTATCPHLADRISGFRRPALAILYHHLRDARAKARAGRSTTADWTFEEWQAICTASRLHQPHNRLWPSLQEFLVRRFRKKQPGLAERIRRLSPDQVEQLRQQMKGQ
jgi:hypothetical protein